jgi:hypothetical protein
LLSPLFTLLIVTLAIDATRLSRLLQHRWLVTLGETAFAIYILEVPAIWIYKRLLFASGAGNPDLILDLTYMPLMISIGLIAFFYVDPALRNWMKNIMKRVSMPLLVLDLAIFALSVYVSLRFRFGEGREFNSYRNTALIMFWSAFLFRTSISIVFDTLNPANLYFSFARLSRALMIPVTIGSLVIAALTYGAYAAGWIENFPRSIFIIDWLIVLGLSLAVRFVIRALPIYRGAVSPGRV